jgi:hypothetical protein
LEPLLGDGSSLLDIISHEKFKDEHELTWTHKRWGDGIKLDYILLSPKLQEKVKQAGIERRGVWGLGKEEPYEQFAEMKGPLMLHQIMPLCGWTWICDGDFLFEISSICL